MILTGNPKSDLFSLLHKLVDMEGSDLHLRVGSPPQVRDHAGGVTEVHFTDWQAGLTFLP